MVLIHYCVILQFQVDTWPFKIATVTNLLLTTTAEFITATILDAKHHIPITYLNFMEGS